MLMEEEADSCSWNRSRWEGVGDEIQPTLSQCREEDQAGPLSVVNFYFTWMSTPLVHFLAEE